MIMYAVSGSADEIVAKLQRIQIDNPGMVVEGNCSVYVLTESILTYKPRRFDFDNGWSRDDD